jgi:hypothetical protein
VLPILLRPIRRVTTPRDDPARSGGQQWLTKAIGPSICTIRTSSPTS